MGQGLQVFNASGQLVFDTPDRLSRVIAQISIAAGASGTISLPVGYGSYWWYMFPTDGGSYYRPNVSISGNTLSYSPSTLWTPAVPTTLIYGIY